MTTCVVNGGNSGNDDNIRQNESFPTGVYGYAYPTEPGRIPGGRTEH